MPRHNDPLSTLRNTEVVRRARAAVVLLLAALAIVGLGASSTGAATTKRVCQKVMRGDKITNYCRDIDPKAGTDCRHPFKLYWWFAGPAARGATKYATLHLDQNYDGPPDYGRTPIVSWERKDRGVVCKVEIKQDDQPLWTSTAQQGSHTLVHIPEKQNNWTPIPNDIRSIVIWVRKAHKK